jgi:hypothetical protein
MKLNQTAGVFYCSTVSEKYMDLGDADSRHQDENVQLFNWQANDERIQPAVQVTIQNEDVLSGRGKQSFNHCMLHHRRLFSFFTSLTFFVVLFIIFTSRKQEVSGHGPELNR